VVARFAVPAWLSGAVLFACTLGAQARNNDIIVGGSVALTGPYALAAREQLQGFQMWLDEVNTRGGLLGRKLRFAHYDDASNPKNSARIYQKLLAEDKADVLIGPYSSAITTAAIAVAEKAGVPMVSAGAAAPALWGRAAHNLFGVYTPAGAYMEPVLQFARERGLKRVALVYEDSDFMRDVALGARARAKALGMQVVFEDPYDPGTTDFSSLVAKIKPKRPDVLIGGSHLPDSVAFLRAAKERQFRARIFAFADGPDRPEFGIQAGLDANGVMGTSQWDGLLAFPEAKEFAARYRTRYKLEASAAAAGGYAAGQVLEAAVKKAGALDRDKLRKALRELETMTAFGRYKVEANGRQVGKPAYVIQWIDGRRQLVLPAEVAAQKPLYPFLDWARR
jgi:branched-chain amino acid transport system substrate-binding protein